MADERFTPSGGFDWDEAEDFTDLPAPKLEGLLARVAEEERMAAYRLEVLRGRMGLIRAELAGRRVSSLSSEELARVLLGEAGEGRGAS